MAKTITIQKTGVLGNLQYRIVDIDITSYTSLGEALTAGDMGLNGIYMLNPLTTENGYIWWYDYATAKMKVFNPTKAAAAHAHTALTVKGSLTAADKTAFVSIVEGDGTAQTGICVAHAGGGLDEAIISDSQGAIAAGAGAQAAAATDCGTCRAFVLGY